MSRWILLSLTGLLLTGCESDVPLAQANLRGAGALALACQRGGDSVPLGECDPAVESPGSLTALVVNRDLGEVAYYDVSRNLYVDTIRGIPGITHVPVGDLPSEISTSGDGRWAYILDTGSQDVVFLDIKGRCVAGRLTLSERPANMLLDPLGVLYISYPESREIAVVDLASCAVETEQCRAGEEPAEIENLPESYTGTSSPTPCRNGFDDDDDGLIDAQDPGCGSGNDRDESDDPETTRCSDGLDNDGDGLVDLADPGCERAADTEESGDGLYPLPPAAELPACMNGLDDDGDGQADWPADPGCESARDTIEIPATAACNNGIDDDNDGRIDGEDSGCSGADDEREEACDDLTRLKLNDRPGPLALAPDGHNLYVGHPDRSYVTVINLKRRRTTLEGAERRSYPRLGIVNACSDGIDNDGDGSTDYPLDPQCTHPLGFDEAAGFPLPECADGLDNDGNGLRDEDDPGCSGPGDLVEISRAIASACHNGIDDDNDGLTDISDPGCRFEDDDDERDPDPASGAQPQCNDGQDNDGDGRIDMDDAGCAAAGDEEEGEPAVTPPCESVQGETDTNDSNADGCHGPGDLRASLPDLPASAVGSCDNGLDDDGDGLVDFPDDPGCLDASEDEFVNLQTAACNDGIDNDEDGQTDRDDTSCAAAGGQSEAGPRLLEAPAATRNDAAAPCVDPQSLDPGSLALEKIWCQPSSPPPQHPSQCNDGRDNDGDGHIDGADPGCLSPWDDAELGGSIRRDGTLPCADSLLFRACLFGGAQPDTPVPPACSNGLDDDGDGYVDFEDGDPGCESVEDDSELVFALLPTCANGLDDDGDGAIDLADTSCSTSSGNSEDARSLVANCANGLDDDGDGHTDSADPGCAAAGDDSEADPTPGAVQSNCDDGLDNDGDGATDDADEDCGDYLVGGSERSVPHGGVAGLAVTPNGDALYVLHRGHDSVMVLDLERGTLLDASPKAPFHRRLGLATPGLPVRLIFGCFVEDTPIPCSASAPDVLAFVTTTSGEVASFVARDQGSPSHAPLDASSQLRSRALQPRFFEASGREVRSRPGEPAAALPATVARAESFTETGGFGVSLSSDLGPRGTESLDIPTSGIGDQTWTATWEGVIPGSESGTGRLIDLRDQDPAYESPSEAELPVVLLDQEAEFCSLGVEAGDHLIIRSSPSLTDLSAELSSVCSSLYAASAYEERDGAEYCVTGVEPQQLHLRALPRSGSAGKGVQTSCPSARPGDILDPLPAGPILSQCFSSSIRYELRSSGQFLVTRGSRLLNNASAHGGRCAQRRDAHPLRTGRALLGQPFQNAWLGFTLHSPADGSTLLRGTNVLLQISGGVERHTVGLGNLTDGIALEPGTGRLFVSEAGFDALWRVDPMGGSLPVDLSP